MTALRSVLIVAVLVGFSVVGSADDSWDGQKVMKAKPEVKFGEHDDDSQRYFELKGVVFTVLKEKDGWLRLRGSDGKEGWAEKADFTLLADAPGVYTDLIKADEKNGWAWNQRGLAWHEKGEWDNAIKDYVEAIRLDPKYAPAFINRGNARQNLKEYDKAIQDYDGAIRLDPKDAVPFINRGNAWRNLKEYNKAIKDYDEAIRLNPKYAHAYFNRGNLLLSTRRPKASADFQTTIDVQGWKGHYATYATILGQLSARIEGDDASAKKFLSNAEGKLDEKAWPYPAVQYLRGDLDEAALLKLATDDDKRTKARCFLGFDFLLRGKKDQALEHFRWVKDKGTKSFVEYTLAVAELDRLEKAKDK